MSDDQIEVSKRDIGFKSCLIQIMLGIAEVYSLKGSLDESIEHGGYIASAMHAKYIKWDRPKQTYAITKKGLNFLNEGGKDDK